MRSRVVTPLEMQHVYGAEVRTFPFAFQLTRKEKHRIEAHIEASLASHLRQLKALTPCPILPPPHP
jgi:hypothetical protein